jgi:hypothetical protein
MPVVFSCSSKSSIFQAIFHMSLTRNTNDPLQMNPHNVKKDLQTGCTSQ